MRHVSFVLAALAFAAPANAADMPDFLRGALVEPAPRARPLWEGFYVGGQGGGGVSDMNFENSTRAVAARLLVNTTIENEGGVSNWPVLGRKSVHGEGWGGFVGYNSQWEDVVVGIEANYMHGRFGGSDSGSMSRIFSTSNGYTNSVTYDATSTIAIRDIGSLRARAGYVWNGFLPYAFGAISLGQADIVRTASISGVQTNPSAPPGYQSIPFALTATEAQNAHFLYGYGGGLGVDMMLFAGLFLRAEWEYLKFAAPIDTSVSTVRAGLGYKF